MKFILSVVLWCFTGLISVQQTYGIPANNWYKYLENYDNGYKHQEDYNYQYGGGGEEHHIDEEHVEEHAGSDVIAPPCNDALNSLVNIQTIPYSENKQHDHQYVAQPSPEPQPSPQPQPQQPHYHQSKYIVPGTSLTTVNVHNLWTGHKFLDHPQIPYNHKHNTANNNDNTDKGSSAWDAFKTNTAKITSDNVWSKSDDKNKENDWNKDDSKIQPQQEEVHENNKKVFVIHNQHQPQIIQKPVENNGYHSSWNNYGNYGGYNEKQGYPVKSETYVHQPASFVIKPHETNLKIIHPEYHVKPAPVIVQKSCHVHNHHAIIKPPPIKVNPILFTINKPVEKKVIIEKQMQPCYDHHPDKHNYQPQQDHKNYYNNYETYNGHSSW